MKDWKIYNKFNSLNEITAGTTTKDGNKYYNFSLALHTGENKKEIEINREKFSNYFPKNYKFISLTQIHSNKVLDANDLISNNKWNRDIEADGIVTNKKEIVLTILTADCLAILMYDKKAKVIGAAHAGWRGVDQNISKELLQTMQKYGARAENIIVAISPSIRGCCYEVGEDVAKHFFKYPNAINKKLNNKFNLDISIVAKEQLLELGFIDKNIEISPICTSCQNSNYFSYRKECGCSGRFMSFIAMS